MLVSVESRSRDKHDPLPSSRERRAKGRRAGGPWFLVLGVVLIAALGYGWEYSVSDDACSRCHYTADAVTSHGDGTHQDFACRRCHVGPGIGSAVVTRFRGLKNTVTNLGGRPSGAGSTNVTNGACLSCHEEVTEGVTTARSINMRHSDVLAIGFACVDCHNTEGHGKAVDRPKYPKMAQCIACHDGERASAECGVCHNEDVGVAVRRPQRPYAQTDITREDCRGCHPQDACIACHGLELPHSDEFEKGYHARKALLQPQMCSRCHSIQVFCNKCHNFQVSGKDAATWKREHALRGDFVAWHSSVDSQKSCPCHDTGGTQFCAYCHGPQPER